MGELVMADPAAQPLYRFSMHWKGGVSRDLNVPFTGRPEPFQINLLTFGPDGQYTLSAVARDAKGLTASDSITIFKW